MKESTDIKQLRKKNMRSREGAFILFALAF